MGPRVAPRVAIIGMGRAGGALAVGLVAAGWPCGLVSRGGGGADLADLGVPWLGTSDAPERWLGSTDLVLLAVRDAELAPLAQALAAHARWAGKTVLHLSGSLTGAILSPLGRAGAAIGSFHPLTSLATRPDGRPADVPVGIPFFGEGDPAAMLLGREVALALGGTFEAIASEDKALYHAAATLAGNLAAVMHAAGGDILRSLGILAQPTSALLPLVLASAHAVAAHGDVAGLTGPLSRGDVETLRANIDCLRRMGPSVRRAHAAVSLLGLDLLEQAGKAPEHQAEMRALLVAVLVELPPSR